MAKHVEPKHDLTEPRSWFSLFRAHGGTLAIIAAVVCVGITVGSVAQYRAAGEYDRVGVEALAKIVERRIEPDTEDGDDHYLSYSFTVDDTAVRRERKVSYRQFLAAPQGSFQTVRYLPLTPAKFETYVGEARDDAVALQWVAGFAGVGSLIAFWFLGSGVNRAILTRKYGYAAIARVDQVVEVKKSGRLTGRGYLKWSTPDGRKGESMNHPVGKLHAIGVGAQIKIYIRKGYSVWEGDVGPSVTAKSRIPDVPR